MHTILGHRLPEGRTSAENDTGEDILETGEQEKSGVFRINNVALLEVQLRRHEPGAFVRICHHVYIWGY